MADISKAELRKEITAILKDADLTNTTAKKVRQELEEKLDCNLSSRRKEIDALVMDYVNKQAGSAEEEDGTEEEEENEASDEEDEASEEDVKKKPKRSAPAPKKKPAKRSKQDNDDEDEESGSEANSDEALSEEEYSPKKATAKPKGKKPGKGRKKKGSDSDSDDDWNKSKKLTKKGKARKSTAFTRPYRLSPELSKLMGSKEPMPRHEVIKRVWAIIKERNLYDPDNKQFAICDDELLKIMGVKRFRTFGMMKYLKTHFLD